MHAPAQLCLSMRERIVWNRNVSSSSLLGLACVLIHFWLISFLSLFFRICTSSCSGMTHEYSNLQDQHDHMTITWNLCIIYFRISIKNKRNIVENMHQIYISSFRLSVRQKGCPTLNTSVKLLIILILYGMGRTDFYLWKHKQTINPKLLIWL